MTKYLETTKFKKHCETIGSLSLPWQQSIHQHDHITQIEYHYDREEDILQHPEQVPQKRDCEELQWTTRLLMTTRS
eukprot:5123421-Amphidinium_carterae.1